MKNTFRLPAAHTWRGATGAAPCAYLLLLLAALCGAFTVPATAQPTAPRWAGGWTIPAGRTSTAFNSVEDMKIDGGGNIYLAGTFSGTAQFGNGITTTSLGQSDGYIAKYSPTGVCRWAIAAGNTVGDEGFYQIAVDRHGNVYATGAADAVQIFAPCGITPPPNTVLRISLLLKLDSLGQCLWQREVKGGYTFGLALDSVAGVYLGGISSEPLVVDTLHLANRTDAVWVAKLDSAGNGQWIRKAGNGTNSPALSGLVAAPGGGVFVTGNWEWQSTVPFRFTPTLSLSNGSSGAGFLARLDGAGNWRWAKGTSGSDSGLGLPALNRQGQLFLAGDGYNGTFTFGGLSGPAIPGGQAARTLVRCDTAGNAQWVQQEAAPIGSGFSLTGLTTDGQGHVFGVGLVRGSMRLPGQSQPLVSVGPRDAALVRFAAATGLAEWVLGDSSAGPGELRPISMAYAGPGGILIAGAVLGGPVRIGNFTLPVRPNSSDSFVARVRDGVLGRREAAPSAAGFTLWPNPARHTARLQVAVAPAQALPVQLYDALGRVVLRATVAAGHTTAALPLAGLAPGIYLVRAGNRSQRLVVE